MPVFLIILMLVGLLMFPALGMTAAVLLALVLLSNRRRAA